MMATLFFSAIMVFLVLAGSNACSVVVSSIATSTVYRQTYYTTSISSGYSCGSWWRRRRCTRYHTSYVYTITSSVSYYVTYNRRCCTGYQSSWYGRCLPYCAQGCVHGSCSSPGVCSCNTGWTGSSCQLDINECSNDLCSHYCKNTQGSYYCSCRENYYLAYDRRSCIDINECTNGRVNVGPLSSNRDPSTFPIYWCEQECINTPGSYRCDCLDGYQLDDNNQSCSVSINNLNGTAISSTSIYLTWSIPENETDYNINYYIVYVFEAETNNSWTVSFTEDYGIINSLHPYYTYYCSVAVVANNITYQFSDDMNVTTHQAAPSGIVQLLSANVSNSTTLNITWSPPPLDKQNGIITHYIIVMKEVYTNYTIQNISYHSWLYISGLHPFYEYSFSVTAVTIGQGPYTSINIVMPEATPLAPPINIVISIIDSRSFKVSWKPPAIPDQNGIIRFYQVVITESDSDLEFNHSTSNEYIIINGVHPYYRYDISVSAFTVSSGPFSDEVSILTPEDVPGSSPQSFNATATSPYSAYFTWDSPPTDQHNGIIIGYVINVNVLETGENFILYSNMTSLSVNDLRPFRTFVCVIAALTKVGIGPYSEAFSVSTPQDAPSSSPIKLHTVSILSRGFSLSWDPPPYSDQNGIISYYVINITEFETGRLTWYTSYTTVLSLSLLHPAYTYYCTIAAFTVSLGPFSIQFNVTTDEEAPSQPPQNLTGHVMSSSSVALSWELPPFESHNGLIVSYHLNITSLRSGTSILLNSSSTSVIINELTPYTTYMCQVAARTSVGLGPYTTTVSFTTNEDAPVAFPNITVLYAVDTRSVALEWTPPSIKYRNGLITKYVVKLQVAGNNDTLTHHNSTRTTTIIGLLIPSYTYQFSVAAYTIALGPFTIPITLTLPEDVPSGYPQSFTLLNTTPYSISLKWSPPARDEQNGVITGYIINVTHADTFNSTQYYTEATSTNITGLDPHTTYVCVIAAKTSVGIGPFSHLWFVQTNETAPDSSPQHFNAIALSSTSIHITWDPPHLQDHNGIIKEYRINVTEKVSESFTEHAVNRTQIIVTGLKPFHVYQCSIVAVTVVESPHIASVSVLTKEDAPSLSPRFLSVLVTGSSSLTASWVAPPLGSHNGIIRKYKLVIHNVFTGIDQSFTTINRMFNISTLNPYTNYSIEVAAFTIERGPFTTLYNITTFQDEPTSPPDSFKYFISNSTDLILQWAPPSAQGINGIIEYYNITVNEVETGLFLHYATSQLYFLLTNLHPFYTYKCTVAAVTIGVGPFTSVIIKMPENVPSSAPLNLTTTDISARSITLSWSKLRSEDENGLVRHYTINITKINTGTTFQLTSSSFEITITNLHPYCTYNITVAAYTIGAGPFSEPILVTTDQDVPSSSPLGFQSTKEYSTQVTLEWLPPQISQKNGIIIGYNITVENTISGTVLIVLSSSTTVSIGSLAPYTTYQCTIAAYTTIGLGPFSPTLYFRTTEAAPSQPPTKLTVVDVTSNTVILSWGIPPLASHNGIIRGYTVRVFDNRSNDEFFVNVTASTLKLFDLQPFNYYNIAVAAFTTELGPFSTMLTVTSLEAVPSGSPTNISVIAKDSFSISLSWFPPSKDDINGVIRNYLINITVIEKLHHYQYSSENNSILITNLHPYYTYIVYVAAVTIAIGPFSQGYTITTPQYAPSGTPVNITSTVLSSTSLQILWEPPIFESQNGVITSYIITLLEMATNSTQSFQISYIHNTHIIHGLHPYYQYRISVAAYTVAQGPSAVSVVTTLQDVPSGPPQNFSVHVNSSRNALLQWRAPASHQINGIIQYYQIELYELDTGLFTSIISPKTHYQLFHLHPFYTYKCNLKTVTIGPGPLTDNITFHMFEDVPSAPPANINVAAITSVSAILSWNPPPVEYHNGLLTGYTIQLIDSYSVFYNIVTTNTTLTLSFLKPFTEYRYSVSANTIQGQGAASNYTLFQTLEKAPSGAPLNISVVNKTSSSFTLQWQSPPKQQLHGKITGFVIKVQELDTGIIYISNSSSAYITLDYLHPYYTYNVSIAAVTVSVGPHSRIVSVQTDQDAPSGPPLSIVVTNISSQTAVVSWNPLTSDEINGIIKHYTVRLYEVETTQHFDYHSTNLSLMLKDLHPYYTYKVQVAAVTVAMGPYSTSKTFNTLQEAPNGTPINITSTALSSTSLQILWEPPIFESQNGVITSYIITLLEMATNSTQSFQISYIHNTHIIHGLHPFYQYRISVAAYTIAQGPSAVIVVTTLQDIPSGPPQNFSVHVNSSRNASLQWRAPASHQINGIIQYYQIELYELDTGLFTSIVSQEIKYQLFHLHPFYTYKCHSKAITIGPGPSTDNVTFQMFEDVPSASPTNIHVTAITSVSAFLSWDPPPIEYHNGIVIGYTLQLIEKNSVNNIVTTNTTLILLSLKPFTLYKCTLSANTSQGQGPLSNYTLFHTQQRAPSGAPFNISITDIRPTSFTLQWRSPSSEQLHGNLTGFVIKVKELDTGVMHTNNTSNDYITLDYLHPYYTYNVSIAAVTVSVGPHSRIVSVQTDQDAPSGPPLSIVVTNISSQTAVVSWNPLTSDEINGIIKHYTVRLYEVETTQHFDYHSTNLSLMLKDLHPYYTYKVQVAAVTVAMGPYSGNITFKTLQDVPSGTPQELHVTVINSTSIFIQWNSIDATKTNGLIISYRINLMENNSNSNVSSWSVRSNRHNITLGHLHPYYLYRISVAGSTVNGIGPFAKLEALTSSAVPSAPPQNLLVTIINSTVVHLEWSSPPHDKQNGPISHYTIVLYTHQTGEITHYHSSSEFFNFSDLHPFYLYSCNVSAFTVAPGPNATASFQTAENIPSGPPINLVIVFLNHSSLLISWSPPDDSKQNGIIRHYNINLKHNTTGELTVYTATNKTQVIIIHLKPFNTYVIEVAAYTIGVGPYTSPVIIQLPQSVPSAPPTQFTVEVLGNITDLHLSWITPSDNSLNGKLLGYQLKCTDHNGHILSATITGMSATLHQAHINTHYTCTVCAFTSVGCGPNAITHISTYENSTVGPPYSLSANTTSTTIQLAWKSPFNPDSLILTYIITYRIVSSSFQITTPRPWVTVTNINHTSCTLKSLLASSTYKVVIFAVTKTTVGLPSKPLTVTTNSSAYISPQNLSCISKSSSKLHCSWLPPVTVMDHEVSGYTLRYKLLDGFDFYPNYGIILEEIKLQAVTMEYTITGLLPYGGYIIEVETNFSFVNDSHFPGDITKATALNVTHPEAPSGKVVNISLNVTSPKSMIISWKPPVRKNWRGIIHSYRITLVRDYQNDPLRHKRAQSLTTSVVVLPKANDPDPSIATEPLQLETHLLEDLEENFQYTVLIVVINAAGSGIASHPLIKTMPQAAPSGPPINITLRLATQSSVNITWQPPSPIDANGIITEYNVIFRRIEINDVTEYSVMSNQTYFFKNGLNSKEGISVKVAAKTVIGLGPFSPAIIFFTNEKSVSAVPGPPRSLNTSLFNHTSVVLKWDPPGSSQDNMIIQYQLFYSGYTHTRIIDGPYSKNTQSTMIIITNLLPGYFYHFKVRAENKAGFSPNVTTVLSVPHLKNTSRNDLGIQGESNTNRSTIMTTVVPFLLTAVVVVIAIICVVVALVYVKRVKKRITINEQQTNIPLSNLTMSEQSLKHSLPSIQQGLETKENVYDEIYEEINETSFSHNDYEDMDIKN